MRNRNASLNCFPLALAGMLACLLLAVLFGGGCCLPAIGGGGRIDPGGWWKHIGGDHHDEHHHFPHPHRGAYVDEQGRQRIPVVDENGDDAGEWTSMSEAEFKAFQEQIKAK